MHHLVRDFKFAVRGLLRTPVFTAVALVSIALGIGANTAIFTFVDQVLLRRLPVHDPKQLVLLTQLGPHYGNNNGYYMTSYPMYEDFRDAFVDPVRALPRVSLPYDLPRPQPIFSDLFCRTPFAFNVAAGGGAERVRGELVSGTYFQALGVGAAIGRVITPDDDRVRGGHPVAVLSYDYWRNRFGGDAAIVGRRITVNNYPFTVIGVSAAGFDGVDIGQVPSIRVPLMMKHAITPLWDDLDNRRSRWVQVFGRLEPGVTAAEAKAALQPYFHALRELETREPAFRDASADTRARFLTGTIDVLPAAQGQSRLRQQLTEPLWMLMATVAVVLLIACANVAGLLIARATSRRKEIAVRLALGAGRGRIVSQLLAESVLLGAAGGTLALIVARWTNRLLAGFLPTDAPTGIAPALDLRVLAFNFGLALVTGVLFGLIPALRSTTPDLAATLKDQVGSVAAGGVRGRKALVVAQVALSVLLLVGAGLFIRSLRNLQHVDLGVRPERLGAFNLTPGGSGYDPTRAKQFYGTLLDRLQNAPGITGTGLATIPILEGNEMDWSITVEGYERKPGERNPLMNSVSPGYFKTLGIPLIAGRDFDGRDVDLATQPTTSPGQRPFKVAVVNQRFAKYYFGEENPIGRHIGLGSDPGTPTPIAIVGVVGDAKYMTVREEIPRQLFLPFLEDNFASSATVYLRTSGDPTAALGTAQRTMRDLDANVPIYGLRTLEQQIDRSLVNERLTATLSIAFGLLATLLAVVGLYGVMAYTVARRTREIGVRIALGAAAGDVYRLVMTEALRLVAAGVAIGLAGAWALSRFAASQLYGVSPNDPAATAAAAIALAGAGLLASYLPARRAARVDPVRALRCE